MGRIWRVQVRLHWTFFALLLLVVWAYAGETLSVMLAGLLWIVAVFGAVLVHELAHCVVARQRGAVVEDILLTPLGGLSQLHDMPEAPADELAIAVVGPATNLVLALLLVIGGLAAGTPLWPPTLFAGPWVARLLWMNVLLGVFNLLPALPMDGGRVLRAALARRLDRRTATLLAARVARYLAAAMVVVGIFYDFWLVLIGVFVYLAAGAEQQGADRSNGDGGSPRSAPPADEGEEEPPDRWQWPGAGLGPPGSGAAGGRGGT